MFKKMILALVCCLFCTLSFAASPWAHIEGFAEGGPDDPSVLLEKIIRGKPIRAVLFADFSPVGAAYMRGSVARQLNAWFINAARMIKESGRTKEFADILPALERGAKVQVVLGDDFNEEYHANDLNVVVDGGLTQKICGSWAAGCYALQTKTIFMMPMEDLMMTTIALQHEIGHALGMGEQYQTQMHSLDGIYQTPDQMRSTMRADLMSCDDADGLIVAIDRLARRTDRGGEKGWKSLCPKRSYTYKNNRPFAPTAFPQTDWASYGYVAGKERQIEAVKTAEQFITKNTRFWGMDTSAKTKKEAKDVFVFYGDKNMGFILGNWKGAGITDEMRVVAEKTASNEIKFTKTWGGRADHSQRRIIRAVFHAGGKREYFVTLMGVADVLRYQGKKGELMDLGYSHGFNDIVWTENYADRVGEESFVEMETLALKAAPFLLGPDILKK